MIDSLFCCTAPENRADARRRQIVEVARTLFIANGFHATGMAQISEKSGIAVGQIYRDFSCKEDIVAAIVTEHCAQFMDAQQLEEAVARQDRPATLAWIDHLFEPNAPMEDDRLFSDIIAESSRNPRIEAIFQQLRTSFEERLLRALALLAPEKVSASQRQALADTIMTISIGFQQHRLLSPELRVRPLTDMLKAMIARQIGFLDQSA